MFEDTIDSILILIGNIFISTSKASFFIIQIFMKYDIIFEIFIRTEGYLIFCFNSHAICKFFKWQTKRKVMHAKYFCDDIVHKTIVYLCLKRPFKGITGSLRLIMN